MGSKRVLFISQEITPFLPETEMSVTSRKLPQAIHERGREVRVFMPKFGNINERRNQLHEIIRLSGMNLIVNSSDHPLILKVASVPGARIQVYFIDSEDFFYKRNIQADAEGKEYADNDERCIFFMRGVLETIRKLLWIPDVIHCHGWMASLVGLYIKRTYADDPCLKNAKVIYSLYDSDFKNPLSKQFPAKLKADGIKDSDVKGLATDTGYMSLSKLAIDFSDGIIQGSANVPKELLQYTVQQKKKFLPFPSADDYMDSVNAFYDEVMNNPKPKTPPKAK